MMEDVRRSNISLTLLECQRLLPTEKCHSSSLRAVTEMSYIQWSSALNWNREWVGLRWDTGLHCSCNVSPQEMVEKASGIRKTGNLVTPVVCDAISRKLSNKLDLWLWVRWEECGCGKALSVPAALFEIQGDYLKEYIYMCVSLSLHWFSYAPSH